MLVSGVESMLRPGMDMFSQRRPVARTVPSPSKSPMILENTFVVFPLEPLAPVGGYSVTS